MRALRPKVLLLIGALLPGCTVGPDFVPPKPETPAQWIAPGSSIESKVTAAPVKDDAWWRNFGDPTLDALVARAGRANLDLKAAGLRIAEARAARDAAAGGAYPRLDADASYRRQRISENTAFTSLLGALGGRKAATGGVPGALPGLENPFDQYQYGFDASWELDLFGRVRRSVETADASALASAEARNDALVSLEAEVARSYIDLRAAQLRRSVLE
ncbi:MAG: TolC family protein, partial [Stellaceae bacterium]